MLKIVLVYLRCLRLQTLNNHLISLVECSGTIEIFSSNRFFLCLEQAPFSVNFTFSSLPMCLPECHIFLPQEAETLYQVLEEIRLT